MSQWEQLDMDLEDRSTQVRVALAVLPNNRRGWKVEAQDGAGELLMLRALTHLDLRDFDSEWVDIGNHIRDLLLRRHGPFD